MDNPLLIAGIASVVIVIGFILAANFREKKKPPEKKWEFDKDGVPF